MSEFVLGTPEYPLIDVVNQGINKTSGKLKLGVRADAALPIRIVTNVETPNGVSLNDYAYGLYIRQLPVRSMLLAANDEIDKRNIADRKRQRTWASGFLGAPGTGKTFFFNNLGRIIHSKGALLVDCSEKDARTLFENPEFDSSSAYREKAAIDVKIMYRNMKRADGLSDESLALLKSVAGEAVKEDENGHVTVDWSAVHFNGETIQKHEYNIQVFYKTLNDICQKEGISVTSDKSNVGIVMKDGELFRVFDPTSPDYGRPVILDELNRAKFGTLDNLYGLLNFLNSPGVKQFKITGADNREIVIDKDKIPETFYLNFTGNQAIEGMGAQLFNDPFLSRVPEGFALKTIPDLTPADYADMICSYLMGGVPGVILRDAFHVSDDPVKRADFISFLQKVREVGLTAQEIKDIPVWQKMNIANADKIIKLSERLGRFLYEIKELAQQRGAYLKMKQRPSICPEYMTYLSKRMIDFRTIPYFFTEAEHVKALTSVMSAFPSFKASSYENDARCDEQEMLLRYGMRGNNLEKVIADWVYMTFCPVDKGVRHIDETEVEKMYHSALELGYMNLIFRKDSEEAHQNGETIADLYNLDIGNTDVEKKIAFQGLRDAIVSVLKNKYKELAEETNESILPISTLSVALDSVEKQKEATQDELLVFNENPDSVKANLIQPIDCSEQSSATDSEEDENAALISTENLLLSLSIHQLNEQNMNRLFPSKNIASEAIHTKFLKTNNLKTKQDDYLLLLYNVQKNKLVVIGGDAHPSVLKLFTSPDRMYINKKYTEDISPIIERFLETDLFFVEEALFNQIQPTDPDVNYDIGYDVNYDIGYFANMDKKLFIRSKVKVQKLSSRLPQKEHINDLKKRGSR